MNVLVVGGGGREHAIVWKLAASPGIEKLYCAPGNGGIAELAVCAGIKATDIDGIVSFAKNKGVDLVVIGPDEPLSLGLADACGAAGIRAFGPRRAEARLEWSKSYAKDLMLKYNIPTARYRLCNDAEEAMSALDTFNGPYVVKADGLALGKGVVISDDKKAAESAILSMMNDRIFGESGASVVLEEYLEGPEMTVLAFTDGKTIKPMLCSQDHKRAYDGDLGPNTGGMGAFAPSPVYTENVRRECEEKIFNPTLDLLKGESIKYHGVLYFGLMLTGGGVRVIEYNSRFGDPETQAVLPLLKNDLLDVIEAVVDERLESVELEWERGYSACVIAASGGYPGKYATGCEISILPNPNTLLFHAGTQRVNGILVTSGGRVLGATALGETLDEAIGGAYGGVGHVSFDNMYYRKDIGRKL